MDQPTLFEQRRQGRAISSEQLLLYALGEFQARGKTLAARDLPLDRLRGALRRAAETFDLEELSDEEAVAAFERLGAQVRRVPPFVAKHPFRVVVPPDVAARAQEFYQQQRSSQTDEAS
ncbi:MAG TPA: hypothetical protein VE821_02490 [Pyrinomonadaceae bacterium]|nr:hypothetical protein [Pyrinomonadaceae bacterium]